jgi:hypothetical protein
VELATPAETIFPFDEDIDEAFEILVLCICWTVVLSPSPQLFVRQLDNLIEHGVELPQIVFKPYLF